MDVPSPTLAAMYNALKNGETTQEHLFDFKEVAEVNLVELHLIIILGMRLENAEINDEEKECIFFWTGWDKPVP